YRQNRQLLTEQIAGELRSASSEAARELDLWLNERLDDLRAAASSYVTSENLAKIQGREEVQALGRLRDYLTSVRQRLPDDDASAPGPRGPDRDVQAGRRTGRRGGPAAGAPARLGGGSRAAPGRGAPRGWPAAERHGVDDRRPARGGRADGLRPGTAHRAP